MNEYVDMHEYVDSYYKYDRIIMFIHTLSLLNLLPKHTSSDFIYNSVFVG
jgi:hypothetical protein